jgi:catechol 2,3-dioxygenase-like lactoylglutathione lyase family enzyme
VSLPSPSTDISRTWSGPNECSTKSVITGALGRRRWSTEAKALRRHKVRHASPGPQRLPDWNPDAGGIEAFYFKDPDGNHLEVLEFPEGKGDPKWHRPGEELFLGIDHMAVVVGDTDSSLAFYREALGLEVAGDGEITLKGGRVEQGNFDTYQLLRINEAPVIEVHIVQSSEPPAGWANPGLRPSLPQSPTRSLRRPANACASCRWTPQRKSRRFDRRGHARRRSNNK